MIEITIKLFGAFRGRAPGDTLRVSVPAGTSVGELRQRLGESLPAELVRRSALGDDSEILADTKVLELSMSLALLPPVCGG